MSKSRISSEWIESSTTKPDMSVGSVMYPTSRYSASKVVLACIVTIMLLACRRMYGIAIKLVEELLWFMSSRAPMPSLLNTNGREYIASEESTFQHSGIARFG